MASFRFETTITCGSCVAKVKPYLDALSGINHWEVDTKSPQKILEVKTQLSPETVIHTINQAGYQATLISQNPATDSPIEASVATADRGFVQTYKPVLLLVAMLTLVSALLARTAEGWSYELMMRGFMGGFFLSFSFFKLLDLPGFVKSYRRYDWIAQSIPAYGWVYPFVEVALGLAYLTHWQPEILAPFTLVLMLLGLGGVLQALYQKKLVQCACLGTTFDLPVGMVTVLENSLMALMAAVMWWQL